jgi:hypothetical protein
VPRPVHPCIGVRQRKAWSALRPFRLGWVGTAPAAREGEIQDVFHQTPAHPIDEFRRQCAATYPTPAKISQKGKGQNSDSFVPQPGTLHVHEFSSQVQRGYLA